MFYHNFYTIFASVIGIGPYCSPALYDTILNMRVIPDIDIIQNDGILDIAVVTNVGLLEDYRIFYLAVHDTAAGNQAVFDLRAHVIFGRGQVVHLGIDIRILLKEVIPDLRL